jgi:glutaminyl-tRNA synthetase
MSAEQNDPAAPAVPSDFIRDIVAQHVAERRYPQIVTRFPPEPNGYIHIGHAKAICIDFGIALENGGRCNLRFDDTNPVKEDVEFVESITADLQWLVAGWADQVLGFKPKGSSPVAQTVDGRPDFYCAPAAPGNAEIEPFFASDYFEQLHDFAVTLIKKGKAYVCDLSPEDTDLYRGAPDKPGKDSPWRNRTVEENLALFARMRAGEFPNGHCSLRARIDMAAPNVWLRDPLLYRIRHIAHHHVGARWCIYPLYDFAHCLSDYLEGVTHSFCTVEYIPHRPLYDWLLEQLDLPRPLPRQYEFSPLKIGYIIVSKRKLLQLVQQKAVSGWDDPRMPTISGLRRRGVPAASIRRFVIGTGVTRADAVTDIAVLEHVIREDLNTRALRRLGVLKPVKIVLTNLAEGEVIEVDATNHPQDEQRTTRKVALTREVYIETDDFSEVPPPKYFRLKPGGEVRLKYACIITCNEVVKDAAGTVVELRCTADLSTRSGGPNADQKVKGTIHWVSATHSITAEVRIYDRLFRVADPDADGDFLKHLNPHSMEVVQARIEASLASATVEDRFQFERLGYFSLDPKDSAPGQLVFNRTISLKDNAAKAPGKA